MNISVLKKTIMTVKFYIQRSSSYLSVVNACMIMVVMIRSFNLPIQKYLPILIGLGAIGLVVWGWIDNKWGLYHEEMLAINRRNPIQIKMFKRFDDLEERLKRIEDKKK
jgi:hypothetical protein